MERLTHRTDAVYRLPEDAMVRDAEGYAGPAADRLGRYEDLCEAVLAEQQSITAALEHLRAAGQNKTARYQTLMGQKLINAAVIDLLKQYRLV